MFSHVSNGPHPAIYDSHNNIICLKKTCCKKKKYLKYLKNDPEIILNNRWNSYVRLMFTEHFFLCPINCTCANNETLECRHVDSATVYNVHKTFTKRVYVKTT